MNQEVTIPFPAFKHRPCHWNQKKYSRKLYILKNVVKQNKNHLYSISESEERKKPLLKQITLKCEKFYEVYIINFEYMDSFFVTVKRESERRWNRLMRRLDKIKTRNKLEPMEIISRGTFCLVDKDDQLHRAMIQNNNERYAICLGLDNGKLFIVDTTKEPIYKMTYKIRNTIEYQAINCKLYDIRMPKSRELNDFVRAEIIDNFKNFRIKVVKRKYSRFVDNRCMAMNKYEVVLIEDETELNINEEIARNIQGRTEFGWDEY